MNAPTATATATQRKPATDPNTVFAAVKSAINAGRAKVITILDNSRPDASAKRAFQRMKNAFLQDFENGVSISIGNVSLPRNVLASVELDIRRGKYREANSTLQTAMAEAKESIRDARAKCEVAEIVWDAFSDHVNDAFANVEDSEPTAASTLPLQSLEEILASWRTNGAIAKGTENTPVMRG